MIIPLPVPRLNMGLILSGGGARAAYQVGVLAAMARLLPRGAPSPFRVICGTSAGAINASILAANAEDFRRGVLQALRAWTSLSASSVHYADARRIGRSAARCVWTLFGGHAGNPALGLLDNRPLRGLLDRIVDFRAVRSALAQGHLDALCITASSYDSGRSVSFFEGKPGLPSWNRAHRSGVCTTLGPAHIMASAAIPFIYPPERIEGEHYGDGAMKQVLPLSPAIRLGAERLCVIGVGSIRSAVGLDSAVGVEPATRPAIGAHLLDSIFIDTLEADLERMETINELLGQVPRTPRGQNAQRFRHLDALVFAPQQPLEALADAHAHKLPTALRTLLRTLGVLRQGRNGVLSYLLTDGSYCRALIRRGYFDGLARHVELMRWFGAPAPVPHEPTVRRPLRLTNTRADVAAPLSAVLH